jgi:hypothetical protein
MEKIFKNKKVLSSILDYMDISDLLNLELTNSLIKSCLDYFYDAKNFIEVKNINEDKGTNKFIRKNSIHNKRLISKKKTEFISKFLNSFVSFPITEEFNGEENEDKNNKKLNQNQINQEENIIDKNNNNSNRKNSFIIKKESARFYGNYIKDPFLSTKKIEKFFESK